MSVVRMSHRLALAAALAMVLGIVALPATALARTATRLRVVPNVTVDNSVPGTTPPAPVVTVKLYRRAGTHWASLSGVVRCYFRGVEGRLVLVGVSKGRTLTFPLEQRGEYEFEYAGSSTYRPAWESSSRTDVVGSAPSTPTVAVEPVDDTYSRVTVMYDVTWNPEAFEGPVQFVYYGWFTTEVGPEPLMGITSGRLRTAFTRTLVQPESVRFSYTVKTSEAVGNLVTVGVVGYSEPYVQFGSGPPFVVTVHPR